jgi:hypothetical protein
MKADIRYGNGLESRDSEGLATPYENVYSLYERKKISSWVKAGFPRREQKPLAAQRWACLEQTPSPTNQ